MRILNGFINIEFECECEINENRVVIAIHDVLAYHQSSEKPDICVGYDN